MKELDLSKLRASRLEIDLDRIAYNMKALRDYLGPCRILGVIKSDAYSHGAVHVARTIMEAGAWALAVATFGEAMELREAGLDYPVLILGYTEEANFDLLARESISQTVYRLDQARLLNQAGRRQDKKIKVHIKIDTGMSRLGFIPGPESLEALEEIYRMDYLEPEGIYSHFAESEIEDKSFSHQQYQDFMAFLSCLEAKGLDLGIRHISNAGAAIDLPAYNLDMVRLGVPIFGVYSNYELQSPKLDVKLSLAFKTRLSNLKLVRAGSSISYNREFVCQEDRLIATLPLGYADGFSQEMADSLGVYVDDQPARVVGRVCMDQTMVDLTGLKGISMDSQVEIFNDRSQKFLSAKYIASLGRRLPRVYFSKGRPVLVEDYLK